MLEFLTIAQVGTALGLLILLYELLKKPRLLVKLVKLAIRFLRAEWHKLRHECSELRDEITHFNTPPSSAPTKES